MTGRKKGPDVPGTTYLLHLDPPYRHARHYVGFAEGDKDALEHRLEEHKNGRGARLLAVVRAAGGSWHLSRTWPDTTRTFERHLKNTAHVPSYCPDPDCQPQRSAARRQARKIQREKAMNSKVTPIVREVRPIVEELAPHEAAQLVRELEYGHGQSRDEHGAGHELTREMDELARTEDGAALSIGQREPDEAVADWIVRTRAEEVGPKQMTLGELVAGSKTGRFTRSQVQAAIADLDVLHERAIVARPEIEPEADYDYELGA